MSFLTPLFLLGLAGLAIPVLLHLIQRERRQIVAFPSLMFLRRIPYQSVQRRRIRNWLLLLMRLAALALIVLAFGRPFFRGTDPAVVAAGGAREVVILDRPVLQHGVRRPVGAGAERGADTPSTRWARSIARRSSSSDRVDRCGAAVHVRQGADCTRRWLPGPSCRRAARTTGRCSSSPAAFVAESTLPRREVVLVYRLPARRLAGRRWRAAPRRHGADAGRHRRCRRGEPVGDAGGHRAVLLREPGARHRDGRA
jgi:hypothetical protein